MRAPVTLLFASIGLFLVAFIVRTSFFWHVVPIGAAEEPQVTWALEAAFLLTALQYIAAIGAVLVLVAVTVQWLDRQIAHRRGANDPERSFDESELRNSPVKDASGGRVWKTKSLEQLK